MRYVGIDLSTDPRKCGICVTEDDVVVHAGGGDRSSEHPDWLLGYCREAQAVAVDVPFGWPAPFVEALKDYEIGVALDRDRRPYLYRTTDAWITETLPRHLARDVRPPAPFSVSADKLGATAMVGTVLLAGLSPAFHLSPRIGGTRPAVVEVYPTLSLWAWALPHRGHRGNDEGARRNRQALLQVFVEAFGITIPERAEGSLIRSEHGFDALVAALTAREYVAGNTCDPPDDIPEGKLRTEGWIRVPNRALGNPGDSFGR